MNKEVDTKVYNPLNGKSGGEGDEKNKINH
jgi:hypothetical protein